jgi:hypothetical protein
MKSYFEAPKIAFLHRSQKMFFVKLLCEHRITEFTPQYYYFWIFRHFKIYFLGNTRIYTYEPMWISKAVMNSITSFLFSNFFRKWALSYSLNNIPHKFDSWYLHSMEAETTNFIFVWNLSCMLCFCLQKTCLQRSLHRAQTTKKPPELCWICVYEYSWTWIICPTKKTSRAPQSFSMIYGWSLEVRGWSKR